MNLQKFYSSSNKEFVSNFLGVEIGQFRLNFNIVSVPIKFWKEMNIKNKGEIWYLEMVEIYLKLKLIFGND